MVIMGKLRSGLNEVLVDETLFMGSYAHAMVVQRPCSITHNLFDGILFSPMLGTEDHECVIEDNKTLFSSDFV